MCFLQYLCLFKYKSAFKPKRKDNNVYKSLSNYLTKTLSLSMSFFLSPPLFYIRVPSKLKFTSSDRRITLVINTYAEILCHSRSWMEDVIIPGFYGNDSGYTGKHSHLILQSCTAQVDLFQSYHLKMPRLITPCNRMLYTCYLHLCITYELISITRDVMSRSLCRDMWI